MNRSLIRGGICSTETSESECGRLIILALHGQDELVAVRCQGLFVIALAEISRTEITVRSAFARRVAK